MEGGEIATSPMANTRPPSVPEVSVPVVADDELRRLLAACEGKAFTEPARPGPDAGERRDAGHRHRSTLKLESYEDTTNVTHFYDTASVIW